MAHKNKTNYSPYKARREKAHGRGAEATSSTSVGPNKTKSLQSKSPSERSSISSALRGRHRRPQQIFSIEEANDRLYDIFRNHGGDFITHEQRRQMARFYEALMKEQEHQNFTRLLTIKDIGIKHFLDSALITRLTSLQFPLMDMGTGPGFPGIPLKILFPEEKILLAEGVQKRVDFLKRVRESLGLKNLDIIGRNIDESFVYPLMGVITRAVEDVSNTLRNVSQCVEVGGRVYLMKGPGVDPELELAQEWSEYYKLAENHHYELPHTPYKRRLLVFEKIKVVPFHDSDHDSTEGKDS